MSEWKRIGKNKSALMGCVTHGELHESRERGGYMVLRTTATKGLWVYVPTTIFREWTNHLRPFKEQLREPYTRKDANAVLKWLRAKMIMIQCEVWSDGLTEEYRCHTRGLMEGEDK